MTATNQFEEDLLLALFTHVTLPNVGDPTGMGVATTQGSVDISLHDPAPTDTSTSNATGALVYTNYAVASVSRAGAQWTISGGSCDNTNAISFATCGATGDTAVGWGLVFDTGSTFLQLFGTLTSNLVISNGITPEFAATAFAITLD